MISTINIFNEYKEKLEFCIMYLKFNLLVTQSVCLYNYFG